MSMTKRWIDNLLEAAQTGDIAAQETLSEAGLWASDEELQMREEAHFYTVDETEIEEDPFEFGF